MVNTHLRNYMIFATFAAVLGSELCLASTIQIRWGLERRKDIYVEQRRSAQDIAERHPLAGLDLTKLPNVIRFFQQTWKGYADASSRRRCEERHLKIWNEFKSKKVDVEKEIFATFKRDLDPSCSDFYGNLAPVLFFDFVSTDRAIHVLDRIEITTHGFEEYLGGGFVSEKAAYDVILAHNKGHYTHKPDVRLRFEGTGRTLLRFWSDNFKPNYGWMTPVGIYIIDISFVFLVEGDEVRVSTGTCSRGSRRSRFR